LVCDEKYYKHAKNEVHHRESTKKSSHNAGDALKLEEILLPLTSIDADHRFWKDDVLAPYFGFSTYKE
jgi:hypothetical protein